MKTRLFLLLCLVTLIPALGASAATILGVVVDSSNGSPLTGATVVLRGQNAQATTNFNGQFRITAPDGIDDFVVVMCDGFESYSVEVNDVRSTVNLGEIRLTPVNSDAEMYGDLDDLIFDETALENDEGATQSVAALTGANDNIYYNTASYNFGPMYFRYRGMDNQYQSVYINGVRMNDLVRGSFSFSTLLGMTSRAFRNKTTSIGMEASNYAYGDIAGSVNYNTTTDLYAPGFNGSVAFTNSNYLMRGMVTYSTGLNDKGWALTVNAIGRYAKEGVMDGTFYNSGGLFMSLQKRINAQNDLVLTAFGGPTQRATGRPTVQEAYDLAGTNLYNPDWGYQEGKKRSSRITETFDPTVMLNWLFKNEKTTLNTSLTFRSVYYNRTALNYYKAVDPNPSYYKYLPSYFMSNADENKNNPEAYEYYKWMWENDESFRQIKWDQLYEVNYLNNAQNTTLPQDQKQGASYIMENRTNHNLSGIFNTYVNTRINPWMSLQGGVSMNYTKGSYYKTVRDLLGGEFWLDIDPFSDREISVKPNNLQNDLDNPNRRVGKGDRFGYDYDIHAWRAEAWLQNVINLPKWDVNYAMQISHTEYYRDGHMRNGRAPQNSLGKSKTMSFDNVSVKAGAVYKIDGRNQLAAHASYGTRAPLFEQVFISPRIGNAVADNIENERDFSGDLSYIWNYRRFRGNITGFYTDASNVIERSGFYDDDYQTYCNYVMTGVRRVYKGVELGMAYKITPSLTATFAGTYARFQYKSNPKGTRSFENGMYADTTQTVYLKNYYLGSTPQYAANIGLDWAAPKNWYFNVNGTFQGDAYVNLSPRYHESLPGLVEQYPSYSEEQLMEKVIELSAQEKLKNSFTLNASIGKAIYLKKVTLNVNLNVNNILNKRDVATYAYQQGRLDLKDYNPNRYPTRYNYAQGIRAYLNIGVRF